MKRFLPPLLLAIVVTILGIINFVPNTYLTGFDNLHPEFNFAVNLQRSLFAVWQEYQGTGLLGGMGHAADLVRQLFLLFLSSFIPVEQLRYVWTMLTLFIGTLGAYYLIQRVCHPEEQRDEGSQILRSAQNDRGTPLLGSLFYLLNLSTIQAFYAPFEVFSSHFASLPWLLLTLLLAVQKRSAASYLLFALVLLLSTPATYVPTIFAALCIAVVILTIFQLDWGLSLRGALATKQSQQRPKVPVGSPRSFLSLAMTNSKTFTGIFLIIFMINSFWLLPFAHFTLAKSAINVNGKINQTATETIFLLNKEFGSLPDVALLKGFWFNSVEPDERDGSYANVLEPWREHLANPVIPVVGYILFNIVLFGLLKGFLSKNSVLVGFGLLFLFTFTMLATAAVPFSLIDDFLRNHIPLFSQAFRFPFTKFSILASLTYALFFAIGLGYVIPNLIRNLNGILKRVQDDNIVLETICYLLFAICLVLFTFPAFQGHLFYEKEQIAIPSEYFDTFSFFQKQDQNTRIANFPQQSFWAWEYYRWGYRGSGFLWYGIKQPILDRAFDVWSNLSENYYYEVSQALYAQNSVELEKTLQKYQVSWLLVDRNVINPSSPKALFFQELEGLIAKSPTIKKAESFGKIDIYTVSLKDKPNSFVFFSEKLPSVNKYDWNNKDQAYTDLGNYITDDQTPNVVYPFRSLFALKTEREIAYSVTEKPDAFVFTQSLSNVQGKKLSLPAFAESEKSVAAEIVTEQQNGLLSVSLRVKTPEVSLDQKKVWGESITQTISSFARKDLISTQPIVLNINGGVNFPVTDETKIVGTTFLSLTQDNVLTFSRINQTIQTSVIPAASLKNLPILSTSKDIDIEKSSTVLTVEVPKITDEYASYTIEPAVFKNLVRQCDVARRDSIQAQPSKGGKELVLTAKNASACLSLYAQTLAHDQGYLVQIESANTSGRGTHFWIENINLKYVHLDTYLPARNNLQTYRFVLPPQDPFGAAYAFHLESVSIGDQEVQNTVGSLAVSPIPYNFLVKTTVGSEAEGARGTEDAAKTTSPKVVQHPNESLYVVDPPTSKDYPIVILSQAYDEGWKAFQVERSDNVILNSFQDLLPFFFGEEVKDHVMVNNWENGWDLSDYEPSTRSFQLVIVYLPQYLQYIGFLLAFVTLAFLLFSLLKRSS